MNCTHEFYLSYPHIFSEENFKRVREINTDKWFLMGSPVGVMTVTLAYLAFVFILGPMYMAKRKPLNVKFLMRAYNIFQVMYNAYTFLQIFVVEGALHFLYHYSCFPMPFDSNPLTFDYFSTCWLYLISKVIDLMDTVFFVVRKKQDQVTFLHIYLRCVMLLSTWYFFQHIKGVQMAPLGIINSLVHTFMYAYYFLSSFPAMQPYLWWKRYITIIQMLQFVMYAIYLHYLMVRKCNISYTFKLYAEINNFIFLFLFAKFYYDTYIKVKKD